MKCYQTILLSAALNESSPRSVWAGNSLSGAACCSADLSLPLSTWQHQREAELSVVLVSALVVLLLYNEPGRPADHSLREAVNAGPLWLHSCIQSPHQSRFAFDLNQRKNPPPTHFGGFFVFPTLLFVVVVLRPTISLIFGLGPLIPTMITMG